MNDGEVSTAVIELKNALQKQPEFPEARAMLGKAHMQLGDYPSALKEFERALDLGMDPSSLRVDMMRTKVQLGRYQEVIGELRAVPSLDSPEAVVLGEAYLNAGDVDAAKPLFQKGAKLSFGSLGLGNVAWVEGDLERASSYFAEAVDLDESNREAWVRLAEFELYRRNFQAASQAFARASQLPGGSLVGGLGLTRVEVVKRDFASAAETIDAVKRAAPSHPAVNYLDGLIQLELGEVDQAEEALREVLRVAPEHMPTVYLMSAVKYRQKQLAQARDFAERFLARHGDNESAAKLLGSIRFDEEDYRGVVEILEPFLPQTQDAQVLSLYGSSQLRLGNISSATDALQRAVALGPEEGAFRHQLALSLMSAGDSSLAQAELETAIEIGEDQLGSEFLLAMLRLREGDLDGASGVVEELIAKRPDNPIGYNLRGGIALARGEREPALAAFERALEVDPTYEPAVVNLVNLAEADGDLALAAARYQALADADPASQAALLGLSNLAEKRGDLLGARDFAEKAVEQNPRSLRAHLRFGRLSLALNQVSAAQRASDTALSLAPRAPDALLLQAEVDLARGESGAAVGRARELQSMVTERSSDVGFLLSVGVLQSRLNNLTLARVNFEKALAAENISEAQTMAALGGLATLELREGNLAAAESVLDRMDELGSSGISGDLLRAEIARLRGDEQTAATLYRSLAESGVRDGVTRLATLYFDMGQGDVGLRVLQDWLSDNEADEGVRRLLADRLLRLGQHSAAIPHYERLMEADDPLVLNNLAWLYLQQGDKRALDTARRANSLAPENAAISDTLGWILVKNGNPREALIHLERGARLAPENPSVQYHLGIAYRESGDVSRARTALEKSVSAGEFPEATDAQEALDALPDS